MILHRTETTPAQQARVQSRGAKRTADAPHGRAIRPEKHVRQAPARFRPVGWTF